MKRRQKEETGRGNGGQRRRKKKSVRVARHRRHLTWRPEEPDERRTLLLTEEVEEERSELASSDAPFSLLRDRGWGGIMQRTETGRCVLIQSRWRRRRRGQSDVVVETFQPRSGQVFNIPTDRQEVRKMDRKQAAGRRELLLNVCFRRPPPGGLNSNW